MFIDIFGSFFGVVHIFLLLYAIALILDTFLTAGAIITGVVELFCIYLGFRIGAELGVLYGFLGFLIFLILLNILNFLFIAKVYKPFCDKTINKGVTDSLDAMVGQSGVLRITDTGAFVKYLDEFHPVSSTQDLSNYHDEETVVICKYEHGSVEIKK